MREVTQFLAIAAALGLSLALRAAEPLSFASPAGQVVVQLIDRTATGGSPEAGFQIRFLGETLLQGTFGLSVRGTNLFEGAVRRATHRRTSDSTYTLLFGKNNPIRNHFNELALDFENLGAPLTRFRVVVRAYDDGAAFRYVLPRQPRIESVAITDEPTRFRLVGDPQMWPMYLANYTTSHEALYQAARFSTLTTNRLMDVPLLAEFPDGTSVSIAQASLRNYAGLYLRAEGAGKDRYLRCDLPPLPGQAQVRVRSRLPLSSPWRVFLVGPAPGRLIESNLILNLNEPNAIGDTSWLRAGKATWYWWSGVQEPVAIPAAVQWEKRYIDFAARNGFAFHAIIGTQGDHPWYHQGRNGYGVPAADADVTRPRRGFPLAQLVAYARSKGVGIRLWVHQAALRGHVEAAFTQYEKWGIAGLMVDFLNRNDQEMVLFTEKVLESAARHHLHIQFHGVWAPTGLRRTYPNLMNHEGVLNLEYLKWSDRCTPAHDVTVPFTRMVAGPMDYHLGGFRGAYRGQFKPRNVRPMVFGTRCHQLAMYVVYENPMPMVCDTPDSYQNQPGFDFLREVPTTWDETRVLRGRVGHYIILARRKGSNWYLGAMTDWTARGFELPLDFLPSGAYQVATWADANASRDPNQLVFRNRRLSSSDTLRLHLNSGGGEVVRIEPVR